LLLTDARREADAMRRETQIEAREQSVKLRAEVEQEVSQRRAEIIKIEERVLAKEDEIDGKLTELTRREQGVSDRETHSKELQEKLKEAKDAELKELERISSMTTNEAKAHLLSRSEELIRHELARRVRQMEEEAQTEAKRRARNLVADALQRVAANHASETTVSLVELPSDDMKGRIIGREGRNIRTLEHLTGVDFIIDDTPQAVVLSSFDGIRREVRQGHAGEADRRRPYPSRPDRGDVLPVEGGDRGAHRHAGEQAVFEANCGPSTRSSSRSSAGCASGRATARTSSSTRSRSSTSPGSWPRSSTRA
jgi:ribonuclease Y